MSGNTDTWAWDRHHDSGYHYPAVARLPEGPNRPVQYLGTRHRRPRLPRLPYTRILAGLALAMIATGVVMAMLTARPGDGTPVLLTPSSSSIAAGGWPGMATASLAPQPNPYADPGIWRVGADLPAGRYRVTVTAAEGGYWARCSDPACVLGTPDSGLLDNRWLPAGSPETILLIKATDMLVVTSGVRLIPA